MLYLSHVFDSYAHKAYSSKNNSFKMKELVELSQTPENGHTKIWVATFRRFVTALPKFGLPL